MAFSKSFKKYDEAPKPPAITLSSWLVKPIEKVKQEQVEQVKRVEPQKSGERSASSHIDWTDSFVETKTAKTSLWDGNVCKDLSDIIGQDKAKDNIFKWLSSIRTKPLLLSGPSGCGKTVLIRSILTSKQYSIWDEMDDADALANVLGIKSPLLSKKRAVLIDCVEGLSGEERSKIAKVLKLNTNKDIPIILTCDDIYDKSLKNLKDISEIVHLKPLATFDAIKILQKEARIKGFPLSNDSAETLLDSSRGNVRQALNSMHFMITTKGRKRTREDAASALSIKDKSWDLFSDCGKICSGIYDEQSEDIASSDLELSLLTIQHNVISSARNLNTLTFALDSFSTSDILIKNYFPKFAVSIFIRSSAEACKGPQRCPRIVFPLYFSKMSSKNATFKALRIAASSREHKKTEIRDSSFLQEFCPYPMDAHDMILARSAYYLRAFESGGLKEVKRCGLFIENAKAKELLTYK